jgi:hypothetical protein
MMVNKVFVQVRLPPELAEKLKDAAEAGGRSLPAEMIRRLSTSMGDGEPEIDRVLFGWTDTSLKRNRALGRCAGALAYRQERLAGEAGPTVLAMLKHAMSAFLDRMGANEATLTDNHRVLAKATGEELFNNLQDAKNSRGAARDLIADSAAFASIAEDLDIYGPKVKHAISALGRVARKKSGK